MHVPDGQAQARAGSQLREDVEQGHRVRTARDGHQDDFAAVEHPMAANGGERLPDEGVVAVVTFRLQSHPHLAVLEVFLLPHRHRLLERVDGEVAGLEGLAAVRRGHRDHHAGLADLEPADPVHEGDRGAPASARESPPRSPASWPGPSARAPRTPGT